MLGYAICVLLAVQTWRGIRPDQEVQQEITQRAAQEIQERQKRRSRPSDAYSNNRFQKRRVKEAGKEARMALARNHDKRRIVWGLILGYPLVVVLGLWVIAGFQEK